MPRRSRSSPRSRPRLRQWPITRSLQPLSPATMPRSRYAAECTGLRPLCRQCGGVPACRGQRRLEQRHGAAGEVVRRRSPRDAKAMGALQTDAPSSSARAPTPQAFKAVSSDANFQLAFNAQAINAVAANANAFGKLAANAQGVAGSRQRRAGAQRPGRRASAGARASMRRRCRWRPPTRRRSRAMTQNSSAFVAARAPAGGARGRSPSNAQAFAALGQTPLPGAGEQCGVRGRGAQPEFRQRGRTRN